MVWAYKNIRLVRPEGSGVTWAEEGESYSKQLCTAAEGGWEISQLEWPWVVFKRMVVCGHDRPGTPRPVDA